MAPTIFYSWQSDTPSKTNRNFIKSCLEEAINRLVADGQVEEAPRLDHGTKGIHGDPDVFPTILRKIRDCDVFVADVSIVALTEEGKNIPNPNVMLELGYAYEAVSSGRIIKIMNNAFGDPKSGLPFDLAHKRWPYTYTLHQDAKKEEKEKVKQKVADDLSEYIGLILKKEGTKGDVIESTRIEDVIENPHPGLVGVEPVQYLIEASFPLQQPCPKQRLIDYLQASRIRFPSNEYKSSFSYPIMTITRKPDATTFFINCESWKPLSNELLEVALVVSDSVVLTHWVRKYRETQPNEPVLIDADEINHEAAMVFSFFKKVETKLKIVGFNMRIRLYGLQDGLLKGGEYFEKSINSFSAPAAGEVEASRQISSETPDHDFSELLIQVWERFESKSGQFPKFRDSDYLSYLRKLSSNSKE